MIMFEYDLEVLNGRGEMEKWLYTETRGMISDTSDSSIELYMVNYNVRVIYRDCDGIATKWTCSGDDIECVDNLYIKFNKLGIYV